MRYAAVLLVALAAMLPLLAVASHAQEACYTGVSAQQASCKGGQLVSDERVDGCRQIACQNGTSSVTVKACDKGGASGMYFELYKIFQAGTGVDACLGSTCIGDSGFAKSTMLPVCGQTPSTNTTSGSATLSIDPLFPQGPNYVFKCDVQGFSPTQYTWMFSDGTSVVRSGTREEPFLGLANSTVINNDVFHTFPGNGSYAVICTATDGARSASAQRTVQVSTPKAVHPSYPYAAVLGAQPLGNNTYRLTCGAVGYPPDVSWRITNSTHVVYDFGPYGSPDQRNITIQFNTSTEHFVSCTVRTYEDRYRKEYYEPNYVPSSSSFGVLSESASMTLNTSTQAPAGQSCGVTSQAPTCVGGQLTNTQQVGGCWEYTCVKEGSGTIIKACDKPGSQSPQYFELYRLSSVGDRLGFCLGSTCIGVGDFTRSVCANQTTTDANATLSIAPYYPKGEDYVFYCNAAGFAPTSYDFFFGDGSSLTGLPFNNSYHRYAQNGTYNVTCIARSGQTSRSGALLVNVGGSATNGTDGGTNGTNQTCYSSLKDIPSLCDGSSSMSDAYIGGCRTIVCTNGADGMQVLACDKPDGSSSPTKFEMYLQAKAGTAVKKVCLGTTCLTDNGFASGSYPYCVSK